MNIDNLNHIIIYHATIWGLTAQAVGFIATLIAIPIVFLVRRLRLSKPAATAEETKAL